MARGTKKFNHFCSINQSVTVSIISIDVPFFAQVEQIRTGRVAIKQHFYLEPDHLNSNRIQGSFTFSRRLSIVVLLVSQMKYIDPKSYETFSSKRNFLMSFKLSISKLNGTIV